MASTALLIGVAEPAMAQVAAPASSATAGDAEIVVYARKRVENIQNVPISVSAISGAIGPSYAINNVQMANVGSYRVRVTSGAQSVESQAGVLLLRYSGSICERKCSRTSSAI